ncbi:hypothetical protein ACOMHN_060978 [Nucella lapillus]
MTEKVPEEEKVGQRPSKEHVQAIPMGRQRGLCLQSVQAITMGRQRGLCLQSVQAITMGRQRGLCLQSVQAITMGRQRGLCLQSVQAITMGRQRGLCLQSVQAITMGRQRERKKEEEQDKEEGEEELGDWYLEQDKEEGEEELGDWYLEQDKEEGEEELGDWYLEQDKEEGEEELGDWYLEQDKEEGEEELGDWYLEQDKEEGEEELGDWYLEQDKEEGEEELGDWYLEQDKEEGEEELGDWYLEQDKEEGEEELGDWYLEQDKEEGEEELGDWYLEQDKEEGEEELGDWYLEQDKEEGEEELGDWYLEQDKEEGEEELGDWYLEQDKEEGEEELGDWYLEQDKEEGEEELGDWYLEQDKEEGEEELGDWYLEQDKEEGEEELGDWYLLTGAALYEHEERVTTLAQLPCDLDTVVSVKTVKSNTRGKPKCGICFQVYHGDFDYYELRFLPLAEVDYSVDQSFSIKLDCRDSVNLVVMQLAVVVRVEPNTPPYFTNLHDCSVDQSFSIKLDCRDSVNLVVMQLAVVVRVEPNFTCLHAKTSQTIAELTESGLEVNGCQDDDEVYGDFLTYTTVSMTPYSSHFTLTKDGLIQVTGDLRGVCHNPITFVINCEDRYEHLAPEPYTVQLTIEDGNQAPSIVDLNKVLEVAEDAADSTTLVTFTVQEGGGSPFCLLAAEPPDSLQFFELDMTGQSGNIKVKTRLNYEQADTRHTNLTVTCSDGFCLSPVAYLYVIITDVNEPLTLLPNDVTLTVYEGSISVDPNWTAVDEDEGDDAVYTIVGGNNFGRFALDPITGVITSTLTYDTDANAMPMIDTIVVQAQDEGGHVGTSTVTLTIVDLNDHCPVFTADSVALVTDNCSYTVGTVIGNVTAIDLDTDFQGNNIVTYSGSNGFINVNSGGDLRVESQLTAGTTYVLEVFASDSGKKPGPLTSAKPATVIVVVTECPATTPTTTTTVATTLGPYAQVSSKENWFWIALSSLLLMVLFSAGVAVAWKFCHSFRKTGRGVSACSKELCGDCCNPPTVLSPGFPDDGYMSKDPSRNQTPSPAPVEGRGPLFNPSWRARALEL